jgi:uncharacterized caspase-like protein
VLTDGNAASRAVSDIFKEIRKAGHFDILVVYLSGHGEVGADGAGWFCLADAQPGAISLGSGQLDDSLGKVSADRVLLLVDCCYVGKVDRYFHGMEHYRRRHDPAKGVLERIYHCPG